MTDGVETEVKIRVSSVEDARMRAERAGAICVRRRQHEMNVLYDFEDGRLTAAGTIVRVRKTEDGGALTYKGRKSVAGGLRSREEIETQVESVDALAVILSRLGLAPVFRYEKFRQTWRLRGEEIVIDETPIGTFLEVEGDPAGIHEAARALGFGAADFVPETYGALYQASGGKGDMLFR